MSSGMAPGNIGDSTRNKISDLASRKSNHVFDGAGENIHYYSDSESVGSKKSKTRYINPAIYVETVEASHSVTSLQNELIETARQPQDVTPHPHSTYRSNSTPALSGRESASSLGSVKRKSCKLIDGEDYLEDNEATPRFNHTYREDGADTFRLSVASMSTTTTAKEERERNEKKKNEAYEQWLARKEQEKKEKARLEKLQKNQINPTTTSEQRAESYRRWMERKRMQQERRRAEEIMRQFRMNEELEKERLRKEKIKDEKLAMWIQKKEEAIKVMKTREECKAARAAIEEQKRRSSNERAYRDWLRTSKNKPLPVPLNQGELSMRGSVSKMYINPVPWQSNS